MPYPGDDKDVKPAFFNRRRVFYSISFFFLFAITAGELGLVSQQLHNGGNLASNYGTPQWKYDLGLLLFTCVYTFLVVLCHTSVSHLVTATLCFVAAVFWATGAGVAFQVTPFKADNCDNLASTFSPKWQPFADQCSRFVAIQGLAWANFAVSFVLFVAILVDSVTVTFHPTTMYDLPKEV